jgi:UDP-N-acetylmuramoyl-tripeptide--D-alanyl-D-alanine ligase
MDSRLVKPGDVFVALATENNDGHHFVADAFEAGALSAIVAVKKQDMLSPTLQKKVIAAANPLTALHRLARLYRQYLGIPIVALTGSSGKTTTRNCISWVLSQHCTVGETHGNWNNTIGVPLSILRFRGNEDIGILECGANHVGEIGELSRIIRPSVGCITNIGYGHIGLFGSLTATTEAKFELVRGLSRRGYLLLNGDDRRLRKKAMQSGYRTVYFGLSRKCDVRATDLRVIPKKGIRFVHDDVEYAMPVCGRHFVYSALPALYFGKQYGMNPPQLQQALQSWHPVALRGGIERKASIDFIVDCYNANPSSMQHALQMLADNAQTHQRVAVLGDMLELGKYTTRCHRMIGTLCARLGLRSLITVGAHAREIAQSAQRSGMKSTQIYSCDTACEAVAVFRKAVRRADTVLLKASRGVGLEYLFEHFSGKR